MHHSRSQPSQVVLHFERADTRRDLQARKSPAPRNRGAGLETIEADYLLTSARRVGLFA
ncbi:hypothetical protein RCH11_001894 [Glaciihabitans sp. GrIS 2.15]|nr:hypothetical protein [Glaciihabitans sp. GrIS 2.15]